MTEIHPTAFVDPGASLGEGVEIGPHCYVGPHVVLGPRCRLRNNVTITGHTTVGEENVFYANTVIGEDPQDLKYDGGPTRLDIGDRNSFREGATVHRGTELGGSVTCIGNDNHVMVGVHIAHDTRLGDHIIVANNTLLAGHVHIEDCVTIGGAAAMHHFCTVGKCAYIAGMTRITTDVPPFIKFAGYPGRVRGINTEGLGRWGYDEQQISALRHTYQQLYSKRAQIGHTNLTQALHAVENNGSMSPEVAYLVNFVKRSLHEGINGRYREGTRTDKSADRGEFYRRDPESPDHDAPIR